MSDGLLPCPFCGKDPHITIRLPIAGIPKLFFMCCRECNFNLTGKESELEAIKIWNTRATWLDWIECSERLPDCKVLEGHEVYVILKNDYQFCMVFKRVSEEISYFTDGDYNYEIDEILYWAELDWPKDNRKGAFR